MHDSLAGEKEDKSESLQAKSISLQLEDSPVPYSWDYGLPVK